MDLQRPDLTDAGSDPGPLGLLGGLLFVVAVLAAVDLVGDLAEGADARHVVVEAGLVVVGLVGLGVALRRYAELRQRARQAAATADELAADLARTRAEAERWRGEAADLIAGLGDLIDRQFVRWGLSPAEREVALLLLKGLSHKEVAAARKVGVATARQQATSVYRKAGVGGRHDLAAFFLEDLLAPRAAEEGVGLPTSPPARAR